VLLFFGSFLTTHRLLPRRCRVRVLPPATATLHRCRYSRQLSRPCTSAGTPASYRDPAQVRVLPPATATLHRCGYSRQLPRPAQTEEVGRQAALIRKPSRFRAHIEDGSGRSAVLRFKQVARRRVPAGQPPTEPADDLKPRARARSRESDGLCALRIERAAGRPGGRGSRPPRVRLPQARARPAPARCQRLWRCSPGWP
jgi:hypothetical protein